MEYYASQKDPGARTVYTYTNQWDANKIYGCACTPGFQAVDCSQRVCPTGDDPLTGTTPTTRQYNAKQMVKCIGTSGYFTLSFKKVTTAYIYATDSDSTMQAKLNALSSVTNSGIVVTGADPVCSGNGITYVEFRQDFGPQPLLIPNYSGLKGTVNGVNASVSVATYIVATKENNPCSNRGICDPNSGLCACNTNYETSDGYGNPGTRGDCGAPTATISACPGEFECSLQGNCPNDGTYRCSCDEGWMGSDCSIRTCPFGPPWFGYPDANDVAHATWTECSSNGICDRSSGICSCALNFAGNACQYLACPVGGAAMATCSGNGKCLNMADLAQASTVNGVIQGYTYGAIPNNPQTWDAQLVYGCLCDPGFTGFDCSLATCPFGDDPLTIGQVNEIQQLTCVATSGYFYLKFREQTTAQIPYSASPAALQQYLQTLSTIDWVNVTSSTPTICGASSASTTRIEFLVPTGDVPMIQVISTFPSTMRVVISEITKGTKEWEECSGRGLCNRNFGQCACFDAFGSSDGQGNFGERGDCGTIISEFAAVIPVAA